MITESSHGWSPKSRVDDTPALLAEALDAARSDPSFGLPRWVHETGREAARARPIVFFGYSEFTYALLACLPKDRMIGLVDDHRKGESLFGVPCMTSEEFAARFTASRDILCVDGSRYTRAVLHFRGLASRTDIQSVSFEQAVRLLRPAGLDYRVEDHLPAILEAADEYAVLEDRLDDELSRETLRRVMLFHLTTCRDLYRPVERPYETLYFRSGVFEPRVHERFVDCGASIGESISGLLEATDYAVDRAWLIEPDRNNIATLEKLMQRFVADRPEMAERITLVPCAVGDGPGRVPFRHAGGHGGNIVASSHKDVELIDEVEVAAIDDIVDAPPTMIKMDVEGYELPALHGAKRSIEDHRPRLCVSAYHRPTDLIDLSRYVLSLRPDYRVGLRHHTPLRWDTCLYFH